MEVNKSLSITILSVTRGLIFALCMISSSIYQLHAQAPFKEVAKASGIDHNFKVYEGMFGGGACVFDANKDGYEDLFLTSGMNEDVFYVNNGDGSFTNKYQGSGLELTQQYVTQGVVGADVNRDGWVDLFITTITTKDSIKRIPRAINLLFLNNGDLTFTDVTSQYGLDQLNSFSTGANFGDFNADGYPDLYVGNYFQNYEGELTYINDATIVNANQTSKGYLLLNIGGKKFRNVFEAYGLDYKGYGFGGVFTDFDNDGDQDLLVNHDFGYKATPNFVLQNQYPIKKFKDVSEELDMDLKINSMGTAVGDYNNDGILEYYMTNIRFNNFMVKNPLDGTYQNMIKEFGMNILTISWGANFADFDHDGDVDLFVSNGDLNPNDVPMGNFYFENQEGEFKESGMANGLNDYGIGRGSVVFDMENDGDLDILVINQEPIYDYPVESFTRLFRNDSAKGNWIKIALEGNRSETHGLGSRIEVVSGKKRQIREVDGGGSSHLSQNSTIVHFGLGPATTVDSIIVKWSSAQKQILLDQAVNQQLMIVQEESFRRSTPNYIIALVLLLFVFLMVTFIWKRRKKAKS